MHVLRDHLAISREEFKKIETNSNLTPCPLCGSTAELWERDQGGHFQKAVMCSRAGDDDEDDCMLYLPPEPFYSATKREAIEYWEGRRWAPQLAAHAEVVEAAKGVIESARLWSSQNYPTFDRIELEVTEALATALA